MNILLPILLVILLLVIGTTMTAYVAFPAMEQSVQLKWLIAAPVAMVVVLAWHLVNRK
jgi:hypothetical protein